MGCIAPIQILDAIAWWTRPATHRVAWTYLIHGDLIIQIEVSTHQRPIFLANSHESKHQQLIIISYMDSWFGGRPVQERNHTQIHPCMRVFSIDSSDQDSWWQWLWQRWSQWSFWCGDLIENIFDRFRWSCPESGPAQPGPTDSLQEFSGRPVANAIGRKLETVWWTHGWTKD